MATKKVKGTKIDLATFVGPTTIAHALPSAPDPNREPLEKGGRGGRGGRGGDRGGRGGFDRDAPSRADSSEGWSRGGSQGGGFDGGNRGGGRDDYSSRGQGGDDRRGGSGFSEDSQWQKAAPRGMSDRNDRMMDRGGSRIGGRNEEPPMERPAHLKLNLKPSESSGSAAPLPAPVEKKGLDKYDIAFSKIPSSGSVARASGDARSGGFDDRRSGGFDDRRGGGFDDRRGGGFDDRRGNGGFDRDAPRQDSRFNDSRRGGGGDFDRRQDGGEKRGNDNFKSGGRDEFHDPRFKFGSGRAVEPKVNEIPPAVLAAQAEAEKKAEELKIAKAEKAAIRAEADAKAKKIKDDLAAAAIIAAEVEKNAASIAVNAADTALQSGTKGTELVAFIKNMEIKPSGAALMSKLCTHLTDLKDLKWTGKTEYGPALKSLMEDDSKAQCAFLFEIQNYCHTIKFPKIDVKGKSRYIIEILFQILYAEEIVDQGGIIMWSEDDNDVIPGRVNAIVQTTQFVSFLQEEEFEEAVDDDEVDAPRQIIK